MERDEIEKQLAQLHPSAFGWAMLCCGRDRELASDVLQETYCRIVGDNASFSNKSKFSSWVFGIIRNVTHEELRRRKRQRKKLEAYARSVAGKHLIDTGRANIEECQLADQLSATMEKLSDRQREILHLTFYQNLTIEQAADVLGISIGAARQHYQRAKAAMRRKLEMNQEFNGE